MDYQNEFMFNINILQRVIDLEGIGMDNLIQGIMRCAPETEETLDILFANTCCTIYTCYATYKTALNDTGLKTFRPAMRRYQSWMVLPEPMQNKISDTVGFVVHIIKNWDLIVFNVTRPHLIYVDVRRLSVEQLSRCSKDTWVENYNDMHMPKEMRRIDRQYPSDMIDAVVENVPGATQRILDLVSNNMDQVRLIGQDMTRALLAKARNNILSVHL